MLRLFKFLFGFVIGGLLGGTVILLITPQEGTELQNKLKGEFASLRTVWDKAYIARKAELEARLVDRGS